MEYLTIGSGVYAGEKVKRLPPPQPTPEQIAEMVKRLKERQREIAATKRRTKKI